MTDDELLDDLQRRTLQYFFKLRNPGNGLVRDSTADGAPASIATVGFALAAYPIAVERGLLSRGQAAEYTLATLRFFEASPQSQDPEATGYRGFYYHFLDMQSGRRAGQCEISTIDTALLLAGALTAARYFHCAAEAEREIRDLAEALYARADWRWACDGGDTVTHGWTPEKGFLPYRWLGYDEALLLYILALGSPTHWIGKESYEAWLSTYRWKKIYGYEYLYAGPLFIHQYTHIWVDFRGIADRPMRERGLDYFENSRRATYVQREHAIRNPHDFRGYHENSWGLTASDGPGPATLMIDGVERCFYGYVARGVPYGPDDGTLAPWAVVASLTFAPEIVLPTIRHFEEVQPGLDPEFGFRATFNPTFPSSDSDEGGGGWVSPHVIGIDEGPIVMMIENFRSGLIWSLMRECPHIARGLWRAGFRGGWLEERGTPPDDPFPLTAR